MQRFSFKPCRTELLFFHTKDCHARMLIISTWAKPVYNLSFFFQDSVLFCSCRSNTTDSIQVRQCAINVMLLLYHFEKLLRYQEDCHQISWCKIFLKYFNCGNAQILFSSIAAIKFLIAMKKNMNFMAIVVPSCFLNIRYMFCVLLSLFILSKILRS